METKNPVGRPLKFKDVEELQAAIDKYFKEIKENFVTNADGLPIYEPITITGLALALGTSRETLCNYEKRDEFFDAIKEAKLRCENYSERMLYLGKSPTGPIFALKNFGWSDKSEVDQNIGGQSDGVPLNLKVNWCDKPTEEA